MGINEISPTAERSQTLVRNNRNPEEAQRLRDQAGQQLTVAAQVLSLILSLFFIINGIFSQSWQTFTLAAIFLLTFISLTTMNLRGWVRSTNLRMLITSLILVIDIIAISALITNLGLPLAMIVLILSILFSASTLTGRSSDLSITIGLVGAIVTAFINYFSPFRQIQILSLEQFIPVILGILVMIVIVLVLMGFMVANLRIKLITAALAISLLPLMLLSLIENQFVQSSITNQANQSLKLAASHVADRLDQFINQNLDTISRQSSLAIMGEYLSLPPEKRKNSVQEEELKVTFSTLQIKQQSYAPSYALLNLFGQNIYDTSPLYRGTDERNTDYFNQPLRTGQPYVSNVQFAAGGKVAYLYFSSPVYNEQKQAVGVLRVRYDARILQNILTGYIGALGARSYPILIDEYGLRLADTITPNNIYKPLSPLTQTKLAALISAKRLPQTAKSTDDSSNNTQFSAALQNYRISPSFTAEIIKKIVDAGSVTADEGGYFVRLQSKPWVVAFVQERTAIAVVGQEQTRLSIIIATLIAGLVGIAATILSGIFNAPILQLTSAAERISSGDLNIQAQVTSNDELGILGSTFNLMTEQLRKSINELEDRVAERTAALAKQNQTLVYRDEQLRTVSDVARRVAASNELESLLTSVTQLISERFHFYHVGIFLLDEKEEYAVLRAANSEGGQRMLARQHKLRVGQVGIVGYVTSTGLPRIATDVGQDAVFFNNPDLPLTRSEMALPLKSGDRIIGALDVQSVESNAFMQDDIDLFSTLADQVAIAIANSTLYEETRRTLEESQNLHRRYLQQEWSRELQSRRPLNFIYTRQGRLVQSDEDVPGVEQVLANGAVIVEESPQDGTKPAVLGVPIKLRGETIGLIRLEERTANREWNADEIATVQSIADQVALALENARLFENTLRRADRERKVLEITDKIRSTNDPQQMMQIATEELKRVLQASRAQIIFSSSASHATHGEEDPGSAAND